MSALGASRGPSVRRTLALSLLLGFSACNDSSGSRTQGDAGGPGGSGGTAGSDADPAASVSIERVTPNHLSTLGGETLTVTGRGFVVGVQATLGGLPATVGAVHADSLVLTAPPLPPGRAELTLTVAGVGTVSLRDAVLVEPLSVVYDPAPEAWAEAPEADRVNDAVPFDVEGDGDVDVVVATDDGLRVLLNDGRGQLLLQRTAGGDGTVPSRPGGRGEVNALVFADLDADRKPELLGCTGAARELHLDRSLTGLTNREDLPMRAGRCLAAVVLPAAEGARPALALALATAEAPAGLAVYLPDATGHLSPAAGLSMPPPANLALGSAETADAVFLQTFLRATESPQAGLGSARLGFALTPAGAEASFHLTLPIPLTATPEHITFFARRAVVAAQPGERPPEPEIDLRIRLVDASGLAYTSAPLPEAGRDWTALDASGPFMAEDGTDTPATLPFVRLDFVVSNRGGPPAVTVEGALSVDTVVATRTGDMPLLLEDFEHTQPLHVFPAVARLLAGDLDGDALPDVLVLPGADPAGGPAAAPTLLRTAGAQANGMDPSFLSEPVPGAGPGPYTTGALLDADRDGSLDAVLVSGSQDRLFVGDGWGRLLDATFGSLPVDWADGRALQVADVNRDGITDLLIGNAGRSDRLYLGRGDGRFLDASPELGLAADETAAILAVDLDADGDLDVVSLSSDGHRPPHVRICRGGRDDRPAP